MLIVCSRHRVFWQNDSSGVNQRPDLYPTIATKVHVYRQSIHRLSSNSITLSPKTDSEKKLPYTLPLDVLVYCTGWTPLSPLYSASMASELGLPVSLSDFDPTKESRWKELEDLKDAEIISRFPALAHPPAYHKSKSTHTPFRLHRAMVPLNDIRDHSIVFLGKLVVGNNFRAAEVQGLWAVAYLDGNLYPSTLESEPTLLMKEKTRTEGEVANTVAWCRRRYLNKGELGSWFYFDMVDYTDMLLAELGLSSHKPRGWLMDIFAPCRAQDLKDLVAEYKSRFQGFIDPPDFS